MVKTTNVTNMSWLKSKSYTLKARKDKQKVEKMDVILKGILSSSHPDSMKRDLLRKIAETGANDQKSDAILSVFQLTSKWFMDGTTDLERVEGFNVYLTWAKNNPAQFEHFFSKNFLQSLLSKKCRNEDQIPVLIRESFRLLQVSSSYSHYCSLMEAKVAGYVRDHPMLECLKTLSEFLMDFKECIPKGDATLVFCTNVIHALSLSIAPEDESEIVDFIKSVNSVSTLLARIWSGGDAQMVLNCLKVIFGIISSNCEVEPSIALGSLVPFLPQEMINIVVKNVISDSNIDNNSMITAIQRIIDWLQWPTSRLVDEWVIAFLKGLASVQKYSVLITVTENKVDQIFEKLQYVPVREPGFNILSHMLYSFQHSPEPFHKILPMVPKIVGLWMADENCKKLMGELAELLHVMMYLHAGFPELYDPVLECIKDYPKPSPDVIKFKLLKSKWTAHRDGKVYVPRSYQQKAEMGKTGLFNLGNTCYMNSILQALYMCDSFRNGLLQHSPSPEQGLVVKLQHVFAFLSHSQRPAYAPVNFLSSSRPPWFAPGFQQDCSEFLKYLLDQLHEQETSALRRSGSPHAPKASSSFRSLSKGSSPPREFEKKKDKNTMIGDNFGGKMETTITCLKCEKRSASSETFMDLPLAFPEYGATSQKSLIGGDSKMATHARSTTTENVSSQQTENFSATGDRMKCLHLNDLMGHYLKPEKLAGDNQYYCDSCGGLQDAERKINIVETPEYLILTLLRFSFDTRLQSRSKIFREVKYPKTLVLPTSDAKKEKMRGQTNSLRSAVAEQLEKCCDFRIDSDCVDIYSLCSVVIHSGTSSDCGHYYCYARHSVITNSDAMFDNIQNCSDEDDIDFLQDKWYLFNDSSVSYASYTSFSNVTKRFTKDTAYVLIYRKIDPENIDRHRTVNTGLSVQPSMVDIPLRGDLRAAVNKDNKSFLQEQENAAAKNNSRKRALNSSWYNWSDDDDKGGSGPCGGGGGGGFGGIDSGPRFVF